MLRVQLDMRRKEGRNGTEAWRPQGSFQATPPWLGSVGRVQLVAVIRCRIFWARFDYALLLFVSVVAAAISEEPHLRLRCTTAEKSPGMERTYRQLWWRADWVERQENLPLTHAASAPHTRGRAVETVTRGEVPPRGHPRPLHFAHVPEERRRRG